MKIIFSKEEFELQEKRMDSFLDWFQNTVQSVMEISQLEYSIILSKIGEKAVKIDPAEQS